MMRRGLVVAVGLVGTLLAVPAVAQTPDPVKAWESGESGTVTPDDLRPVKSDATSFEGYDYWFWLDDGRFVLLEYVVTTLHAGFFGIEQQGSLKATVVSISATTTDNSESGVYRARRGFSGPDGEWNSASEGFAVTFDDCYMRGDGKTFEIALLDDTVKVEATLEMEVEPWQAGDGITQFGYDRSRRIFEHFLPRFRVSGRMATKESKGDPDVWAPISGVGYAEHRRTTAIPSAVGRRWSGFRAMRSDGLTILFNQVETAEGYGGVSPGWLMVALDGRPVFASSDAVMVPTDLRSDEVAPSRYAVPYGYRIQAHSGTDFVDLEVSESRLVLRENPLARVSALIRAALASAMAPMAYELHNEYRATLQIDGHSAQVGGTGWSSFSFPK